MRNRLCLAARFAKVSKCFNRDVCQSGGFVGSRLKRLFQTLSAKGSAQYLCQNELSFENA
jgi:hypothetical protein